ncbi:MAG: glycosyltransferase, partial [Chitinophagia bacterium]|nr:glycosyltransferase [Chitinophagia bacterium]
PMHLFGLWGFFTFFTGFIFVASLITDKIIWKDGFGITNKPAFYLSLTAMIIGTLFFLTGFIAELVVRNAPDRNNYLIEEELGF